MNKVVFASDHAGFRLKEHIKKFMTEKGYEVVDCGTYSEDSCDYPDFGHKAAKLVENGEIPFGIGFCSSGNGMQMTLNKHQKIRAALCWLPRIAELARQHNNANFIVLPANFITQEEAEIIVDAYLAAEFEGGRHLRRVNKIALDIPVEGEVV